VLRRIVRALVVLGVVFGAAAAFAFSTGPPLSRTGAPPIGGKPGEGLCTLCHNLNPPNQANGMVEILDLPESYTTGQAYPLRVRLTSTANAAYADRKWGFELTAVYEANGLGAGTWIIPESHADSLRLGTYASTSSSTFKTRVYVTHTSPSTYKGSSSPVEWSFSWVAPPSDSGTVIFCVAGNAANGDSLSLGTDDQIYTGRDTVRAPGSVVGVPPPAPERFVTALEPPYPNPMTWQCVDLTFAIARAGEVELAIFDAQGRRVRTTFQGWHEAGPGFSFWDGRRADGALVPNGVYFVRLKAPGEARTLSRRLVVAR